MTQSKQEQSDVWTIRVEPWLAGGRLSCYSKQKTGRKVGAKPAFKYSSRRCLISAMEKEEFELLQELRRALMPSWLLRLLGSRFSSLVAVDNSKYSNSHFVPVDRGMTVHAIEGAQAISPNLLLFDTRMR